ncbi:uncharacterized protein [Lepeophtheirus salmonis]|nr:dynein regulatory complex subunit 6-like [Lepeophtheirus salmonis]
MEWLPSECLASIFQYLSLSDRLRCRCVSSRWKRILLEWSLLNEGRFLIRKDTQWTPFFSEGCPYLFHSIKFLHLESVSISYDRYRHQWDALTPRLRGLVLQSSDISSTDFISILSGCVNLRSLHLVRLRDLFLSGVVLNKEQDVSRLALSLSKLRDLNLSENRYMSDFIFSRLVHCAKELESLDISGCNILNGACAPTSVFTFPELFRRIAQGGCHQLKTLNLSSTGLDDKGLFELSELSSNLSLKNINLSSCSGISGEGLLRLLESQTGLETLNLDHCHRWMNISTEDRVCQIALRLAKIPNVSLAGLYIPDEWNSSSKKLFQALSKGNLWRQLNVSGVRVPGESLIHSFTTGGVLCNLRYLLMSNFSSCFSSERLLTFFGSCRDLRILNLSGVENVTDSVLTLIFSRLKDLESLNLNGCVQVTDIGLGIQETPQIMQSPRSDADSKIHKRELTDVFIDDVEDDIVTIKNLTKLRELFISSTKVTSSSIRNSFFFKDLSKIDVSYCFSLDDSSFVFLGDQCPLLQHVIAKKCNITDVGFIALTKRLKILSEIDVEGNQYLSSHALDDLPLTCRYLKVLNISHCYKISQDAVARVEEAFFNLTLYRHMYSTYQMMNENFNDPILLYKKSKKFEPWKLFCCVSKPSPQLQD